MADCCGRACLGTGVNCRAKRPMVMVTGSLQGVHCSEGDRTPCRMVLGRQVRKVSPVLGRG